VEAVAVTRGPKHHWFGYYDKSPWDTSGRFMLAGEIGFIDREPTGEDAVTVGVIDLEDGCAFRPIAESRAWCWQTGCMMQWLGPDFARRMIYNDMRDGRFVSVIRDVGTDEERVLPQAVLAVSHDGHDMWHRRPRLCVNQKAQPRAAVPHLALCVNMSRLNDMRPGYGYPGLSDPNVNDPAPDDDGVWVMDLDTGESRLVLTCAQVAAAAPTPNMAGKKHWLNHLEFNPSATRFSIIHRWSEAAEDGQRAGYWGNQFLTANVDGSDLHVFDLDGVISHYDWRDDATILGWAKRADTEKRYFLMTDRASQSEIVGEGVLDCDGHCSFQPIRGCPPSGAVARPPVGRDDARGTGPRATPQCGVGRDDARGTGPRATPQGRASTADGNRWVLTDTYPQTDDLVRTLLLYHPATGKRIDIGHFHEPRELWEARTRRCDLHPRWRRDGKAVCVDCVLDGTRHMAVLDVSGIVGESA